MSVTSEEVLNALLFSQSVSQWCCFVVYEGEDFSNIFLCLVELFIEFFDSLCKRLCI